MRKTPADAGAYAVIAGGRRLVAMKVLAEDGTIDAKHPVPCLVAAEPPHRKESQMTAQTLPDNPNFCFVPAYDVEDEVQQIRIVIEGMSGHVPTALVTLTIQDAEEICDKLNRRLGLDREAIRRPWRPHPSTRRMAPWTATPGIEPSALLHSRLAATSTRSTRLSTTKRSC